MTDIAAAMAELGEYAAAGLPQFDLMFEQHQDRGIHLLYLGIQQQQAGLGTKVFAEVLAISDRHSVDLTLDADPTLEPGDPDLFTLAKWYSRFGFTPVGLTDQDWLIMARAAQPPASVEERKAAYEAVKHQDLTWEAYRALLEQFREDVTAAPSPV